MHRDQAVATCLGDTEDAVLSLYDPLRFSSAEVQGRQLPLESDITAPLVFILASQPQSPWDEFTQPTAETSGDGLYHVEPYQPGKIPVVMMHGLLSNRFTWATMLNEQRAVPDIPNRYQFWIFQYPTGQSFVQSAALLRRQLRTARDTLDPMDRDRAWDQMVLIGHSMGGLITKMQATCRAEILWRSIADRHDMRC